MTEYVCGFAFNESRERVLLIRKNRPSWQQGFLNGIGGHIEKGEPTDHAMKREFFEECGLDTLSKHWKLFCVLTGDKWRVYFYKTFNVNIDKAKSKTDEIISLVYVNHLPKKVIFNLRWLIPFALDETIFQPIRLLDVSVKKAAKCDIYGPDNIDVDIKL